jgi:diaminopimelate decarboxylase
MAEVVAEGFARDARGVFTCGGRPLDQLLAEAGIATPVYVYDLDGIAAAGRALCEALPEDGLCAYAIKANGAAPIVKRLLAVGCGVDVVSGGELRVALACGTPPDKIVYSGVAKRDDEIDLALASGIRAIHVESVEEIERIAARAKASNRTAAIAIRLNPGVEVDTHAHVATGHDEAKFGVARADLPRALDAVRATSGSLRLVGLSVHVGSQLLAVEPYLAGVSAIAAIALEVRAAGFPLSYLDTGGGFGVAHELGQRVLAPSAFVAAAREELLTRGLGDLALVIEPGRSLVSPFGVLVARVIQPKRSRALGVERRWLLIDAGMNDLIRPALYQARHRIESMTTAPSASDVSWRVAGPVCESSDDFGEHLLPDPPPTMVVIGEAGAYGRSMASAYNARPLTAEVFVASGRVEAVRPAPGIEQVVREEMGVPL